MPAELRVERSQAAVLTLTVSHPEKKGALTPALLGALDAALAQAEAGSARALVLQGEPGAFSAGYDVSALEAPAAGAPMPDALLGQALSRLQHLRLPTVALLEGPAFGAGCELACACDFRVGDGRALFCMPPAKLGVVYALDGLARVARLCGTQRARRMFLTAHKVRADEALAWGLLDVKTEDGRAAAEAQALAQSLAELAPLALAGMKKGLGLLEAPGAGAAEVADYERLRRQAFESRDAAEGVTAFLEKRPGRFQGR